MKNLDRLASFTRAANARRRAIEKGETLAPAGPVEQRRQEREQQHQQPSPALPPSRHGELSLRATMFSPDGKVMLHAHDWAGRLDPATLGTSVPVALLRQGARELIDGIAH